jgi:hypothetical protein
MSITMDEVNAAIAAAVADALEAQELIHTRDMTILRASTTSAASSTSTTSTRVSSSTGGRLKILDVVGKFNLISRSTLEVETSALTLLTMSERDALSPNERAKIQTQFYKGVLCKDLYFKAITSANDLKEMMSLNNLVSPFDEQKSALLISHISSISAHGVFCILKIAHTTDSSGNVTTTLIDPDTPLLLDIQRISSSVLISLI